MKKSKSSYVANKLRLLSTNEGLKSASLKLLAQGLSTKVGYKVWRSTISKKGRNLFYGGGVDKITQYKWFKDNNISCLDYTTDGNVAKQWLADGKTVFGRKLVNSSCGKGIVVMENGGQFVPCPVYTQYKKKKREFRVHVFENTVVAVVEKKRRKEFNGERDTKIRNLANGYVFVQGVQNEPAGLRELAVKAAQVSKSAFRGVDIGYNEKNDELFIIEVNSQPGIQGSNVAAYINAII